MLLQLKALPVQHGQRSPGVLFRHHYVLRLGRAVRFSGFGGLMSAVLVDPSLQIVAWI